MLCIMSPITCTIAARTAKELLFAPPVVCKKRNRSHNGLYKILFYF